MVLRIRGERQPPLTSKTVSGHSHTSVVLADINLLWSTSCRISALLLDCIALKRLPVSCQWIVYCATERTDVHYCCNSFGKCLVSLAVGMVVMKTARQTQAVHTFLYHIIFGGNLFFFCNSLNNNFENASLLSCSKGHWWRRIVAVFPAMGREKFNILVTFCLYAPIIWTLHKDANRSDVAQKMGCGSGMERDRWRCFLKTSQKHCTRSFLWYAGDQYPHHSQAVRAASQTHTRMEF